jgi:hypothetical protein
MDAVGRLTEADVRLYTTLARFDAVYYSHFKCNQRDRLGKGGPAARRARQPVRPVVPCLTQRADHP